MLQNLKLSFPQIISHTSVYRRAVDRDLADLVSFLDLMTETVVLSARQLGGELICSRRHQRVKDANVGQVTLSFISRT